MILFNILSARRAGRSSMGTIKLETCHLLLRVRHMTDLGLLLRCTLFNLSVQLHMKYIIETGNTIGTTRNCRPIPLLCPVGGGPEGRHRYPPQSKVERNNYRWLERWAVGPVDVAPAERPSTNRRSATAHDICMRAARTRTPHRPLKYTKTDREITRDKYI